MKTQKKIFLILSFILLLGGCVPHRQIIKKSIRVVPSSSANKSIKTQHIINVFVHGTHLFPHWFIKIFMYCQLGLHHTSSIPNGFIQKNIAHQLAFVDSYEFPVNTFYSYVWSGKLCFKARKLAALRFLEEMSQLVEEYTQLHNHIPKLRVITTSHGGNTILNVAAIKDAHKKIHIDELLLLCCPVQHETAQYIKSPLFGNVYSLYSTADYIQKLDPQGLYSDNSQKRKSLFSDRRFKPHPKLKQAKIKINGITIGHMHFASSQFMQLLPQMLKELKEWKMEKKESIEYILSMHI